MPIIIAEGFPDFVFDAVVDEVHSLSAEVTRLPVEEGVDITDHARPAPEVLRMRSITSATPLPEDRRKLVERYSGPNGSAAAAAAGYLRDAYDFLRAILGKQLVTVATSLKVYDNMMLTSIEVPRGSTNVLEAALVFEQVRTATTLSIEAPLPSGPRGANLQHRGTQPTIEAPAPVDVKAQARAKSFLTTGIDWWRSR